MNEDEQQIRECLNHWAEATRTDKKKEVLHHHEKTAVFFDVLPPLRYNGTEAYRKSWDEWQPEFELPSLFEFEDLQISTCKRLAYCHGIIRCGGTLANGELIEDRVRATFCLRKSENQWRIAHQHISKPFSH